MDPQVTDYCTYSTAYSHKQLSHCFGVVHHDSFNSPIQHFDFLGPLLLLVFEDVLLREERKQTKKKKKESKREECRN